MCLYTAKYGLEVLSGLYECLKQTGHMKTGCRVNWLISLIIDIPATIYIIPEDDKVKQEAGDSEGILYISTLAKKKEQK